MYETIPDFLPDYPDSGIDNPEGLKGCFDPMTREIIVFADKADLVGEVAKTAIHEATHARLDGRNSQRKKVMCFVEEILHEKGSLTYRELPDIIKYVKKSRAYAGLSWR